MRFPFLWSNKAAYFFYEKARHKADWLSGAATFGFQKFPIGYVLLACFKYICND